MESNILPIVPFEHVIAALLDADTPLNPRYLYRLSDLEGDELAEMKAVWPRLPAWRRQALMEDVEELNEADMLLNFEALGRIALTDDEPRVRTKATHVLWDYNKPDLIPIYIEMMQGDPDIHARAAAATALGRFVYDGEVDELPEAELQTVEEALIAAFNGADGVEVRRAALESLGFSSRDEIPALIEKAFASDDKHWKAVALFAMGRSASTAWKPQVLAMLESNLPLLRAEAARAAGEIELSEGRPLLIELLDDPDDNTRQAAIWSLSQIGGHGIAELLQRMYENADEDEANLIEAALDNLSFTEGVQMMPMFDLSEDEDGEDEEDWEDDYGLEEIEAELFEEEDYDDYEDDEDTAD